MPDFIHDDFLLDSKAARRLYHDHAEPLPIFDFHCHLDPADVSANRRFRNLTEIWLGGDHYKWRAMRANGIPESHVTGDAPDRDKFLAWARTVPFTLRNPLHHWTHLELARFFGIHKLLNEQTAPAIWDEANEKLASPEFTTHAILHKFRVAAVCTTDDPADTLDHHILLKSSTALKTRMYPTFRPDAALAVGQPEPFKAWVARLEKAAKADCSTFGGFLDALERRHEFFHDTGGRLSDHGLAAISAEPCEEHQAAAIFRAAIAGQPASPADSARFETFLMRLFGRFDASRNWTKQLHLGALRNANSTLLHAAGPNSGSDTIGDPPSVRALACYLDELEAGGALPKMILYNLNPASNYAFAALCGAFQGGLPGRIQFGSGWWFLDQKEGIEWQLNALSQTGLLRRFVGMLTDSRSFLSWPRHEYFRRILCNLLGDEIERGLLPRDFDLVGALVRDVAWENASRFFGLAPGNV